ncbi:MAG: ATP:cob(I)alamin adenosyltransferase, partial [Nanoarchaeota archaeon]
MGVYTKIGDKGKTAFFGCGMIQKDDPRIEALGAVDEFNSIIGVPLSMVN